MKDKLGNYGFLFRVLVDAQNRYASRIIPCATLPINNPEKKGNIHELVMEISKDVLKSWRNITGERLYFVIDAMEELYQNKTTYVRTIMPKKKMVFQLLWKPLKNEKSYPQNLRGRTIVQILSYCPKPNKNVLLVSTAHSEPDFCEALYNKPVVIDFYDSQGCGVGIVNQMLCDYTCQPTCGSWVLVVLTFILDLAAVNARTILKYNKANYDETRVFLRISATSLIIPYIKKRAKVNKVKPVAISTINDTFASCGEVLLPDIENDEDQPDDKGGES